MRVHLYHPPVQVSMFPHQHLRIPCRRYEDGVDTARQRSGEAVCNLEADEESVCYHDRCEFTVRVIAGIGEDEIEVCEQSGGVGHKGGSHRKNGTDEALVDERIDTAV